MLRIHLDGPGDRIGQCRGNVIRLVERGTMDAAGGVALQQEQQGEQSGAQPEPQHGSEGHRAAVSQPSREAQVARQVDASVRMTGPGKYRGDVLRGLAHVRLDGGTGQVGLAAGGNGLPRASFGVEASDRPRRDRYPPRWHPADAPARTIPPPVRTIDRQVQFRQIPAGLLILRARRCIYSKASSALVNSRNRR